MELQFESVLSRLTFFAEQHGGFFNYFIVEKIIANQINFFYNLITFSRNHVIFSYPFLTMQQKFKWKPRLKLAFHFPLSKIPLIAPVRYSSAFGIQSF